MTHRLTLRKVSLWVMSFAYFAAGLSHFIRPGMYLPIMPPFLPFPLALIFISGMAEIGLALALVVPTPWPNSSSWAAWGIIALLIAVFPANIYMYVTDGAGFHFPHWLIAARLPFQAVLVLWSYFHTRK